MQIDVTLSPASHAPPGTDTGMNLFKTHVHLRRRVSNRSNPLGLNAVNPLSPATEETAECICVAAESSLALFKNAVNKHRSVAVPPANTKFGVSVALVVALGGNNVRQTLLKYPGAATAESFIRRTGLRRCESGKNICLVSHALRDPIAKTSPISVHVPPPSAACRRNCAASAAVVILSVAVVLSGSPLAMSVPPVVATAVVVSRNGPLIRSPRRRSWSRTAPPRA